MGNKQGKGRREGEREERGLGAWLEWNDKCWVWPVQMKEEINPNPWLNINHG